MLGGDKEEHCLAGQASACEPTHLPDAGDRCITLSVPELCWMIKISAAFPRASLMPRMPYEGQPMVPLSLQASPVFSWFAVMSYTQKTKGLSGMGSRILPQCPTLWSRGGSGKLGMLTRESMLTQLLS